MTGLTPSDKALLLSATRELRKAPRVLGHGRADALRSAPFLAHREGRCPRCGKRIAIGDTIRYHADYLEGLVHDSCRTPRLSTPRSKSTPPPRPPVCPSCWTEHAGECL